MGGLGLRSCAEHAPGAYAASWNESKAYAGDAGQLWQTPACIAGLPRLSQSAASEALDQTKVDGLLAKFATMPEHEYHCKVNLESRQEERANIWISCCPSYINGYDLTMTDRQFTVAVKRLLNVPLHADNIPCPFCKQNMNMYGSHALCCTHSGDRIARHNRMRNVLHQLMERARLQPIMEKNGLLGDAVTRDGRRPMDTGTLQWGPGKALAIDVAVISPHVATNRNRDDPVEDYVLLKEHKYDGAMQAVAHDFVPAIFTTSGAVSYAATQIIKQINRFGAKETGERYIVHSNKAWALISSVLQRSVALQCLARMPSPDLIEIKD
jgi:hypothetical protein